MTCWQCHKEMCVEEPTRERPLRDIERAIQRLTPTPLRFWVCECGSREMEVISTKVRSVC